jgi:hypothetical protein
MPAPFSLPTVTKGMDFSFVSLVLDDLRSPVSQR